MQVERRELQQKMTMLNGKLKELHAALDKVQRGDERYLALLTEEYEILRDEKRITSQLAESEREERDRFTGLSSAVRESHERERARAERTKYWSIIGSVIGATIGIVGSSVNNYRRNRELRRLVRESASGGAELNRSMSELVSATRQQQDDLQSFLSGGMSSLPPGKVPTSSSGSQKSLDDLTATVTETGRQLGNELADVKRMLAAANVASGKLSSETGTASVVYVGPEITELFDRTENNLGNAMRKNAIMSSVLLYSAGLASVGLGYAVVRIFCSS